MDLQTLLNKINTAKQTFEILFNELPISAKTMPGQEKNWSPKDVLAHITWHEQEMIGFTRGKALTGSPWWMLPLDERNNLIFKTYQDHALEEIYSWSQKTYPEMMCWIKKLTNEEIITPASFKNMPHDLPPWKIIADNTYLHYQSHLNDLNSFLVSG